MFSPDTFSTWFYLFIIAIPVVLQKVGEKQNFPLLMHACVSLTNDNKGS